MNEERFFKELGREVDSCFDNVNDALRALWSIREDVKETHKNCNISKTVGTSVKGLGVLSMVAGIVCPPLAIVGGIAAVAGTTTNVTTEVIRKVENEYVFSVLFVPRNALATKYTSFNALSFNDCTYFLLITLVLAVTGAG